LRQSFADDQRGRGFDAAASAWRAAGLCCCGAAGGYASKKRVTLVDKTDIIFDNQFFCFAGYRRDNFSDTI